MKVASVIFASLVLLGTGGSAIAQTTASNDALAGAVDSAAANLLLKQKIPGVAIAVMRAGTIVYAHAYGYADTAKHIPMTTESRFEIGSITKQFTAASIVQLARGGKLSLDDALGKYVPEYPRGKAVTIRQLLSHTSGIPEYLDGPSAVVAAGKPGSLVAILARIAKKPLDFTPGTKWEYSNTNYILLGSILERTSRQRYDAYIRQHIFAPAGMTESGFISGERAIPTMAIGYETLPHGIAVGHPLQSEWAGAAGAIVSTVGDLAKWDNALLAGTIVAPADVRLLQTALRLPDGKSTSYGFGWVIDTIGGHPRVWHNGGTFGFSTCNMIYPSDGEVIIVLGNLAETSPETASTEIFTALHSDVAKRLDTAAVGEDPAITARVREWIKRFATADIDRSQLSTTMSNALTPSLVSTSSTGISALGEPTKFVFRGKAGAAGMNVYTYLVTFEKAQLNVNMALDAEGKIAGFNFTAAN